jgi:putative transposase
LEKRRREMVAMARRGHSIREIARKFRVSRPTVERWIERARGQRLDRASFHDLSSAPRTVANRSHSATEELVLKLRRELKEQSALGEFGALAILRELQTRNLSPVPSVRTIGRILERGGALDYRRRVRRPAPPKGWYLAVVASGQAEIDLCDFVEGLVIRGKTEVEVFNIISLHGGLAGSFPAMPYNTEMALTALLQHWRAVGLPDYAQFDNDIRFQGPHQYADTIGRVIRLCLNLGVVPTFAPPREHGLQNAVESYNGLWQEKVWGRFEHHSLAALQEQSAQYISASRSRNAQRIDSAPPRRKFPQRWQWNPHAKVRGLIIYIRRTNERGDVTVLGRTHQVSANWIHRLVRCEVDIARKEIRCYALRRTDWKVQPLLRRVHYELPPRYVAD